MQPDTTSAAGVRKPRGPRWNEKHSSLPALLSAETERPDATISTVQVDLNPVLRRKLHDLNRLLPTLTQAELVAGAIEIGLDVAAERLRKQVEK